MTHGVKAASMVTLPTMTSPLHTPILIVGGGPVGMNMALNLAYWETPCLIVNDQPDTPKHPQGNSHNARTMENYRRLGIADEIRTVGLPPDHCGDAICVTRINAHEMGRIVLPTNRERVTPGFHELDLTPEPNHRASQMFVEAVLKRHIDASPLIDVRFGWRMLSFEQDDGGVRAEIENLSTGETVTVTADYLVGCDGGQGSIRKSLGISYEGKSGKEVDFMMGQMLSIYFRAPTLYDIMQTDAPWQFHCVNSDGRTSIVGLDGQGNFLSWAKLPAGADPDSVDPRPLIYAAVGEELPLEIISSKPWTAGLSLVTERYGENRVWLAGDSCHLFTPTGGFGMNTGVDDTSNLAWKLAAVHHGWGGAGLIASYEEERRPIAVRNLAQSYEIAEIKSAISVPDGLEDDTPEGADKRKAYGERFMTDLAEEYGCIGIQLGAQYVGSSIIVDDGSTPPKDDPYVFTPSATPGCRAPHAWLNDGRDPRSALFYHFGRGFTLLNLGEVETKDIDSAAAKLGIPLKVLSARKELLNLYQAPLTLIRPDQYVCWRGTELSREELTTVTGN